MGDSQRPGSPGLRKEGSHAACPTTLSRLSPRRSVAAVMKYRIYPVTSITGPPGPPALLHQAVPEPMLTREEAFEP